MLRYVRWVVLALPWTLLLIWSHAETTEKIRIGDAHSWFGDSCVTYQEPSAADTCPKPERSFWWRDLADLGNRVDDDLDLLLSVNVDSSSVANQQKADSIARAIDVFRPANRMGWFLYDLEMVFNYFSVDSVYGHEVYDFPKEANFRVFRGSAAKPEDDHIDLYLHWYEDDKNGHYPEPFSSPLEDAMVPGQKHSHCNSVGLPAKWYNINYIDPEEAAAVFMHEFEHMLDVSNGTLGTVNNEMIPSIAGYMADAGSGEALTSNEVYDRSLLGGEVPMPIPKDGCSGSYKGGGRNPYSLYALWGAWLLERFPGPNPGIPEDDLVYAWVRERVNNSLRRDLVSLASTLGHAPWDTMQTFAGCVDGDDRMQLLYRRHALARWMDPAGAPWADSLAFPEGIDPWYYIGLFEMDSVVDTLQRAAVWIPPTFVLDETSLCDPDTIPDPSDEVARSRWVFYSPIDGTCDFVSTPVWGTSYYVFEAGDLEETGITLSVDVEVTNPVNNTKLFLDWIAYTAKGSLYAKPESVATAGWGMTSEDGLRGSFEVPDFGQTIKSVVAVLSMVQDPVSAPLVATQISHQVIWQLTKGCTTRAAGTGSYNVLVCPEGDAGAVEAVVEVFDEAGHPDRDLEAEDVWLEVAPRDSARARFSDGDRVIAEGPTWPSGRTTIRAARMSGCQDTCRAVEFDVYVLGEKVHTFGRRLRSPDLDGDLDVDADDYAAIRGEYLLSQPCPPENYPECCGDLNLDLSCAWEGENGDSLAFFAHLNHAASFSATATKVQVCPAGDLNGVAFSVRDQGPSEEVEIIASEYDPDVARPCGSDVLATGITDSEGEITLTARRFGGTGAIVCNVVVGGDTTAYRPRIQVETPDDVVVDCAVELAQAETTDYSCQSVEEPGQIDHHWHGDHSDSLIADTVFPYGGLTLTAGQEVTLEWIAYADQVDKICLAACETNPTCAGDTLVTDYSPAIQQIDTVEALVFCLDPAWWWTDWVSVAELSAPGEGPEADEGHWYADWQIPSSMSGSGCKMRLIGQSLDGRVLADTTEGYFFIQTPPLPSCPRLQGWTGEEYRLLNSLFPLGGPPESREKLDAFSLPWLPDTTNGEMRLRLVETEAETSWVNTFAIAALDHPQGTRVMVTQGGRPFLAGAATPMDSLRAAGGAALAATLNAADDRAFDGDVGDTVSFVLAPRAGKDASVEGGGIGLDAWKRPIEGGKMARGEEADALREQATIRIETYSPANRAWLFVADVRPRDERETAIVDLATLKGADTAARSVRLVWTGPVRLDAVRLIPEIAGSISQVLVPTAGAVHSTLGEVGPSLLADDRQEVRLLRGEQIDLRFALPALPPKMVRDFVVLAHGRFRPESASKGEVRAKVPASFFVQAPRPNPGLGPTRVELGLPEPAPVRLRLFDLSGRQVREIDSGLLPAGYHEIVWDGRDENGAAAAGGVYFFQLQAGRFQEKGRIVVLR